MEGCKPSYILLLPGQRIFAVPHQQDSPLIPEEQVTCGKRLCRTLGFRRVGDHDTDLQCPFSLSTWVEEPVSTQPSWKRLRFQASLSASCGARDQVHKQQKGCFNFRIFKWDLNSGVLPSKSKFAPSSLCARPFLSTKGKIGNKTGKISTSKKQLQKGTIQRRLLTQGETANTQKRQQMEQLTQRVSGILRKWNTVIWHCLGILFGLAKMFD